MRTLRNAIALRPGAPGLPLRGAARHRQDLDGAHPREGAELRPGPDRAAGRDVPRLPRDRGGHLARRRRDGRRLAARHRRHPRDPRPRRAPAGRGTATRSYILDEAHQLTDAAWNALLKLIEEPPPHLVFVFCTTDLSKVLPTVRSRCQTFVFQRPRLQELVTVLGRVAEGEGIDAPPQALSLVARAARGSLPRRDLDARPARGGDGEPGDGAVGAPAARRGRGGGAVPAVRPRRRPRHRRRAHVRRGAVRAGARPRPPRLRPDRAPAPRAARAAPGRGARVAARRPRRRASACARRRTSSASRP